MIKRNGETLSSIETNRLLLRPWRETDVKDLYEYAQNDLVGPNAGWQPHKNIEESKSIIEMFIEQEYVYAIELKENEKVIGGIGMYYRYPNPEIKELKQMEIGYVLNPKYWGHGYVPEAVKNLLNYGFQTLHLDLIWCGHYDFNNNSKRVNEKCGFKFKFIKEEILEMLDHKRVKTHYYNINRNEYDIRTVSAKNT